MTEMAPATPPFGHRAQEQPGEAAWAQRTRLELGALPGAVPCARLHARLVLREWGLAGLDEAAELVVSELVTNAVQASAEHPGPAVGDDGTTGLPVVWLWLASDGRSQVAVEVGDGSPLPPVPDTAPHDVEGGRGLVLVETLSRDWGYYYPAEEDSHHDGQRKGVTKVVWALLAP